MTTPGKRGLDLSVLLFLLIIPVSFAAHTSTITNTYIPVYETNEANLTLNVENDISSTATINQVDVQTPGFLANSYVTLIDWMVTNNNSILVSTATAGISNWGAQRFGINVLANNVNQDTTYDWTITTIDTNGDSSQQTIQLQVLNDATPPVVGVTTPGAYILGTNNELFSIAASDAETAIANSNLYISNCDLILDPLTNTSSMQYTTVSQACSNGLCSIAQDLSTWNEGDVCYRFDVSNKGGETATSSDLTTIIDRTPPTITLMSPINNTFLNTTTVDLQFTANDNYATAMNCTLIENGNSHDIVANSGSNAYNLAVTDGVYSWSVSCSDEVGLIGTSNTETFNIDNQPPVITIIAPNVTNRGNDVVIQTSIVDNGAGVNSASVVATITDPNGNTTTANIVNDQITYSTSTSTQPGIYTIQIDAGDNLGLTTTQSAQFRIRETYNITLTLSQQQIDASTINNTLYVNLTGNVIRDDGVIANGTIDLIEIIANETLVLDALGNFATQIQIPETDGSYVITGTFVNGIDIFTITTSIAVGPYCGNGVINNNEQCDGSAFTNSCSDYGFSQGTLSCSATCIVDNSQCSNPPPAPSGRSSGRSGRSGGSSIISYTPASVLPVLEEPRLISGIIEPPTQQIIEPQTIANDIIEPVASGNLTQEGLGIGAAWGAFSDFTGVLNSNLMLAVIVLGLLLYVFGWRKKEDDEWDNYFKRHGRE